MNYDIVILQFVLIFKQWDICTMKMHDFFCYMYFIGYVLKLLFIEEEIPWNQGYWKATIISLKKKFLFTQ